MAPALGKLTDIAADWAIVHQVFKVTLGSSGCSNSCEYSGNAVCQDGEQITPAAQVCYTGSRTGYGCASANLSVLPASCKYGTDCDDC